MDAPSLFERYLAQCREAADWSKQPDTLFEGQARNQLLTEGYRIDDRDPLHKMAIAYRVGSIRDCVTNFTQDVDAAYIEQIRAKGGRPPKSFDEIIVQIAAYYRCKSRGKANTKAKLCSIAAKGLGKPATAATVRKALDRLPHIALALQSQFPKDAAPDEGGKLIVDLVSSVGRALAAMQRDLSTEQKLAEKNRKSARFAPVLVCGGGAP